MNRERERKIPSVRIRSPHFSHLRECDNSNARAVVEKRKRKMERERQHGRKRGRENVSVPAVEQNTNAEKGLREG